MTRTVRDVCERYGVGEHTVLGWIRSGELRAVNVGRRSGSKKPRWRITQEAQEAFEQLRTATPPPPRCPRRKRPADVIEFYKWGIDNAAVVNVVALKQAKRPPGRCGFPAEEYPVSVSPAQRQRDEIASSFADNAERDGKPLPEWERLVELEDVIGRGWKSFVEVGLALMEIRDSRLYRETHKMFEDYCRKRWGMGRRYANRTIEAAGIAEDLGPFGPTNEAQVRELNSSKVQR